MQNLKHEEKKPKNNNPQKNQKTKFKKFWFFIMLRRFI